MDKLYMQSNKNRSASQNRHGHAQSSQLDTQNASFSNAVDEKCDFLVCAMLKLKIGTEMKQHDKKYVHKH